VAEPKTKIAELLRQRAELDLQLADAFEALALEPAQSEPPTWVKLKKFCELYDFSDSTVRRYIVDGMPHRLMGSRNIRINCAAAEAWLEAHGIAYRRRAGKAA